MLIRDRLMSRFLAFLTMRGLKLLSLLCGLWFLMQPMAFASEPTTATQLFEVHCAGCHVNGGNIIRRGKTLKQAALKRNGVDTAEAIATLITNGKGNMPAYRDRLTPEEIDALTTYVLERAAQNWR